MNCLQEAMFRCLLPWRCNRQIEYIDRRHGNLTFVPDEVYRYERYLQELYLDANQIKDLPRVSAAIYYNVNCSEGFVWMCVVFLIVTLRFR